MSPLHHLYISWDSRSSRSTWPPRVSQLGCLGAALLLSSAWSGSGPRPQTCACTLRLTILLSNALYLDMVNVKLGSPGQLDSVKGVNVAAGAAAAQVTVKQETEVTLKGRNNENPKLKIISPHLDCLPWLGVPLSASGSSHLCPRSGTRPSWAGWRRGSTRL